jgi:hypothetical protein
MRVIFALMALLLTGLTGFSQKKLVKGMVVDSLTLEGLPGVHVRIKNSELAAATDPSGIFAIVASEEDTLSFTSIGYARTLRTVDLAEEIMFVRLRSESLLLKEIVIHDTPLFGKSRYIQSPTLSTIRPLAASRGGVNFAYFTKMEKEKRKLVAVISELEQARVYIEIVTDPDFRYNMMKKFDLTEDRYYELLAIFNQTHPEVIHSSNESKILYALHYHFEYPPPKR